MAQYPPQKSLPGAGMALITHTNFPQVWLRPKEWEIEFNFLRKELRKDYCRGALKPLEDSSPGALCLVYHIHALERGVVKSQSEDGKCSILLIDTGCEMEFAMENVFEVPEPEEPGRNTHIMEHPTYCAQVSWDRGDSITEPKVNLFAKTFMMMKLPMVDYKILPVRSAELVPVVELTAGEGDLVEKITSLYTALSLVLQQPASSSSIPPSLKDPTPGRVLSEGAVITRFESSDNFTIMDLATKKEVVCFADKVSQSAKIEFSREVDPLQVGNERKIFVVDCDSIRDDGRCVVTLTNIPQEEDLMEADPSVE